MKVNYIPEGEINVGDLKSGQIAVITKWGRHTTEIGTVVQRVEYHLFPVGGKGWWPYYTEYTFGDDYMVKLLPKGTILEID